MDSVLRPRDIQARIRAGEAPEDVAAAAQTTVDKIIGFATPVLAERAYQAQLAQKASVRRRAATGHVGNLGVAVAGHLETLDVDPESVEWDAWRREDGRWTVVAAYQARGEHRQAAFTYDAAGRFVVADDEEARSLVGERTVAPPEPSMVVVDDRTEHPDAAPVVREEPASAQTVLGDDAIHLVTGRRVDPLPAPRANSTTHDATVDVGDVADVDDVADVADVDDVADLEGEVTIDLTDASASVRSAPSPTTADADWISTQASERPAATAEPSRSPEPGAPTPDAPPPDGGQRSEPWDSPGDDDTVEGDAREEEQAADTLFEVPAPAAASARPARAGKSRARASVPSWDEIMFGTPKSD